MTLGRRVGQGKCRFLRDDKPGKGYFAAASRDGGGSVEGGGKYADLDLGAGCVAGVDALGDAGDDHGGVAGELAGSVDGVLVPGAFG